MSRLGAVLIVVGILNGVIGVAMLGVFMYSDDVFSPWLNRGFFHLLLALILIPTGGGLLAASEKSPLELDAFKEDSDRLLGDT